MTEALSNILEEELKLPIWTGQPRSKNIFRFEPFRENEKIKVLNHSGEPITKEQLRSLKLKHRVFKIVSKVNRQQLRRLKFNKR